MFQAMSATKKQQEAKNKEGERVSCIGVCVRERESKRRLHPRFSGHIMRNGVVVELFSENWSALSWHEGIIVRKSLPTRGMPVTALWLHG
jgi:hypothetical protein